MMSTLSSTQKKETNPVAHVVLNHCKHDTQWVEEYLQGVEVESFTIISSCGEVPSWYPKGAVFTTRTAESSSSSTGKYQTSYASWIVSQLSMGELKPGGVVLFLNDDEQGLQQEQGKKKVLLPHMEGPLSASDLVAAAASTSTKAFSCRLAPGKIQDNKGRRDLSISAFHRTQLPKSFSTGALQDKSDTANTAVVNNLEDFWRQIGVEESVLSDDGDESSGLARVCYGGVFAVTTEQVTDQDLKRWQLIETILAQAGASSLSADDVNEC